MTIRYLELPGVHSIEITVLWSSPQFDEAGLTNLCPCRLSVVGKKVQKRCKKAANGRISC